MSANVGLSAVNKNSEQCNVKNDQMLFEGIQKAMEALQELRTKVKVVKVDSINFIETIDKKDRCEFSFDLFYKNIYRETIHLGRAEIILSKNNWKPTSRGVYKGNDKLSW